MSWRDLTYDSSLQEKSTGAGSKYYHRNSFRFSATVFAQGLQTTNHFVHTAAQRDHQQALTVRVAGKVASRRCCLPDVHQSFVAGPRVHCPPARVFTEGTALYGLEPVLGVLETQVGPFAGLQDAQRGHRQVEKDNSRHCPVSPTSLFQGQGL